MIRGGDRAAETHGFTIIEVMIVLAVTGVMFLAAVLLVSGKQGKTQFSQAINSAMQSVQQAAEEVSSGYYPNSANFSCVANGVGLTFPQATQGQGTNEGCVFLGKMIAFDINTQATAGANQQYNVYTLAGCQKQGCTTSNDALEATPLASTDPRGVLYEADPTVPHNQGYTGTDVSSLQNGLQLQWIHYFGSGSSCPQASGGCKTRAFGFVQSLGSFSGCSGLCSGSQQANLYAVKDNLTTTPMTSEIDQPANLVPATGVAMCLSSGTTNQSGLISVGSTSSAVTLAIKNGSTCGA